MAEATRAFIALGGNLGDVAATFESALRRLDESPEVSVRAVASTHGTRPVGKDAGEAFLNSAAEVETTLGPADLLARLHEVEAAEGRERTIHWGPRTLDLDLLLNGDTVVDTPTLHVPHSALWYRRFVLDPLVEIAADVVHPVKRITIAELRDRLLLRPLTIAIPGADEEFVEGLAERFDAGSIAAAPLDTATFVFHLGEDVSCFDELPLVSRVDVSPLGEDPDHQRDAIVDVLTAALG